MTIADAPPPPLQMLANPSFPSGKLCVKWAISRVPDILARKTRIEKNFNGESHGLSLACWHHPKDMKFGCFTSLFTENSLEMYQGNAHVVQVERVEVTDTIGWMKKNNRAA